MSCYGSNGMDESLLFFFLILILMFCKPSIFGCGCGCEEYSDPCG